MSKRKRFFIIALILSLFAAGFYPLCIRLISQIYYQKAVNYAKDGNYLPAIKDLEKAIHFQQPRSFGRLHGNDNPPAFRAFSVRFQAS